ncbi:ISAs1 family transposase [Streptosporangium sp. NBC_01639]|uniref:ISAs1 family transposase n=1 Tax=Streptosporangium sp. NBC_01639 TaxID=2975948 RepID=UPI00386C7E2E|nr:ISAs1 family transposase [Streptosporangium sp. NBC_01639]
MPVAPSSLINAVGCEQVGQTDTDSSARLKLTDRFALISDPRSARGRRHSLASILAIVACATVAVGGDCLTAIEQWADNAPQQVLADLHIWRDPFTGLHQPPSERTIRRVLAGLDGDELDACLATFLGQPPTVEPYERAPAPVSRRTEREARRAARRSPAQTPGLLPAYAVDGKRLKGAHHPGGGRVHLISLAAHLDATVHAQRQIPAKSSEISALDALLRQATDTELTGAVITADALHTQRASARLLIDDHHAHYVMIVKANQPTLRAAAITALTGPDANFITVTHREFDRGHGRTEHRILRTAPAGDIDFPHAAQVFRILRHRGGLDGIRHSKEVCYGITDLTPRQAGPAQLAAYVRGHWKAIENGVHHVRDVTFAEDACQARTATLPRALAAFRNLATGTLRRAGHVNIAHARRDYGYDHQRVLDLFNLGPK